MSRRIKHHDEAVCELELKSNSSTQDKLYILHETVQRPGLHVLSVAALAEDNFKTAKRILWSRTKLSVEALLAEAGRQ